MRKPPERSPDALTTQDLVNMLKKKQRWTSTEIREELLPKYTSYDRDGLDHKIRQILSYLTNEEKIRRIDRGVYQTNFNK